MFEQLFSALYGINAQLTDFLQPLVGALITLAGLAAGFFVVISGLEYMTSRGNPKRLNHAKRTLKNTALGFLLVIAGVIQKVKMQAGVTSKIGRFIFSPSVKNVFNQDKEDCLDFDEIINKKKILICNFSKGLLGEDASQLFSATVLAQIQLTVLEQVYKTVEKRTPFYLYVDEFQIRY